VERSTVKNPEVSDCAAKVILGLKFRLVARHEV